jgi:maleylpyruvate isomerase
VRLQEKEGLSEARAVAWARDITSDGLDACERLAEGPTAFCFSEAPSLADICLVPQLLNARRYGADARRWPRLTSIEAACLALPAFAAAAPERQPDAE